MPIAARARSTPKSPPQSGTPAALKQATETLERLTAPLADDDAAVASEDAARNRFDRAHGRWLRARAALDGATDPSIVARQVASRVQRNSTDLISQFKGAIQ